MKIQKASKSVRLYYGIFLGVFTVVVGILFAWQVLAVFSSSSASVLDRKPFTREIVLEALSKIDLFFWLWIGAIVVGFVLWEVFPLNEKARKIHPDLQYARLIERLPSAAPDGLEAEYAAVKDTQKLAFGVKIAGYVLSAIAVLTTVIYLCIPSNFNNKAVTLEMLDMAKVVVPVFVASAIAYAVGAALVKYSVKKSLPSLQKVTYGVKQPRNAGTLTLCGRVESFFDNKTVMLVIRIVLAVLAVALIIWGSLNGNAQAVFIKAINICTECIGLG
ncbi:MAG: CD1871A family CXXC motif-containing protein [Candidatus Coproplasma sp.]